ncbi:glutathione peroxidase [Candidatus Thioglobus sp.]|nr:glutathione peroxidase [Candidatus Thioglobus sp.]MDB3893062.1 glutathione peroxidase [Candidatus Thioglobus sp.]MDC0388593.1 glutathione peroxidase [Candidatus Thioglobus sp.]MDC0904008.1 glutathione peroxidase [Candidatus Thioglobus sp.]MDC0920362.1 glutathione peroxidase [Candidatus Thioglobus sp.]
MKIIILAAVLLFNLQVNAKVCSELLDLNVKTLNKNEQVNLCKEYQGKVLLVVNTASRCAYTEQYDSLEKLYTQYKESGLLVLGFPSNDFGYQEPGNEKEIKTFCEMTYGVDFPMFSKTRVTEQNADPLYKKLAEVSGAYPQWNFHKYLIDSDGQFVKSYRSSIDPMDEQVISEIKKELKKVKL